MGDARLYTLTKVPDRGRIGVECRLYHLYKEDDFRRFIDDICTALIDAMVVLSPIAEYSAQCLKKGGYRDFLNIPSTQPKCVEPHCWHLFVPKFLNQDRAQVPGDFLEDFDVEDPAMPPSAPKFGNDYLPSILNVTPETFNVTETSIDLNCNLDVIRAVRDGKGNPVSKEKVAEVMNFTSIDLNLDTRVSKLIDLMEDYGEEGTQFLVGNDDEPLCNRVVASCPTAEEPMETKVQTALDIEMDGDLTIISGGGFLMEDYLVYDGEGKVQLIQKDSMPPSTAKKRKTRITLPADDLQKFDDTMKNLHDEFSAVGEYLQEEEGQQ